MESHLTEFQTIVGDWLRVEPTEVQMVTDGVNKNLRATVDYRAVYSSLLEEWLGTDADGIIPGAGPFARPKLVR